jgi:hypothetical protein
VTRPGPLLLTLAAGVPPMVPRVAIACAVCFDGGWGTRGFGWPFVALMLAPFAVAAGAAAALAWGARRRPPLREPPGDG